MPVITKSNKSYPNKPRAGSFN